MSKYEFTMPIGDWSNDGHGQCKYYNIHSDKPIGTVREAHYKIEEKTGINVEDICSDFEDSKVSLELVSKLRSLGLELDTFDEAFGDVVYMEPYDIRDMWVHLLNIADPELNLKVREDIPSIIFQGADEQGRHISTMGYGCFYL